MVYGGQGLALLMRTCITLGGKPMWPGCVRSGVERLCEGLHVLYCLLQLPQMTTKMSKVGREGHAWLSLQHFKVEIT